MIVLVLLGLAAEVSWAAGFSACAEKLAAQPREKAPVACLYKEWQRSGRSAATLRRMEELLTRYPQSAWLAFYLGYMHVLTGELETAEKRYRQAVRQFAAQRLPREELGARKDLYALLLSQQRHLEAGEQVRQGVQTAMSSRDATLIAVGQLFEARHLFALGENLPRSLALLRRTQAQVFPQGPYRLQRECLEHLGNLNLQLGRYGEARSSFRQLAELARREEDPDYEISARYGLVRTRLEEEIEVPGALDRKTALKEFRDFLSAAERTGSKPAENRARWLLVRSTPIEEARGHLDGCLSAAGNPGEQSTCWSAWARRLGRDDPAAARSAADRALRIAVTAGDRLAVVQARREQLRASWAAVAPDRLALADEAFSAIEAFRDSQGPEGNAAFFSSWADDYHWLSGRLLSEPRPDLTQAFAIIERMRARSLLGALAGARRDRLPASLAQIRSSLADDEALLSFQIAPWRSWDDDFGGGSWLLAVTREGARLYPLESDRVILRPAVEMFAGLFARRDGGEARPAASLYRQLVGPALADLPPGIRRLVIIPDDALHRLPFAALRPASGEPTLAENYQISVVPSATLWRRWRLTPDEGNPAAALALADPPPNSRLREREPKLGPLPYAREEGRAAVRALGGESRLVLGQEASEALLKSGAARSFAVLHLATHALVDGSRPEHSGIVLAPGAPSEDGFLQTHEIAGLKIPGQVVVLSSCRSAGGPVLRGEGVMGLARAFFQAGAPTVVASLWPLRDDDAALLFARFYRHLGRGASVAAALQAAQKDRLEAGAPAEAWAGVVVLGNGDQVPAPGGRRGLSPEAWAAVAGGLVLLSIGSCLVRRRFRNR